ncbi:MAG: Gfo/Idh/MocA family oxidoreductase [Candidatus Omnitrophota bacterium]
MGKNIRVGVIGAGALGSIHAKLYSQLKDVELVGICDVEPVRLGMLCEVLHCAVFRDHRKLFGLVDAVSIAVPTSLHFEIAKDFLLHDTHILVEKPITINLTQADALLRLAERKKLVLQVGHIERFNAAVNAIKHFSSNPRFIECHRLGPFARRVKDIGVVLDLMIHDIDIVLALVNSKPASIAAVGVKILSNFEDLANARITFENGCVCNLTASRVTPEAMRKIRIFETNAYISLDYMNQSAMVYKKCGDEITAKKIEITKEEPLRAELISFIDCVKNKKRPIVSGQEARDALKIALEIVKKIHMTTAAQGL